MIVVAILAAVRISRNVSLEEKASREQMRTWTRCSGITLKLRLKKKTQLYGNVICPPIISNNLEDSTSVIEVIPWPELHLLICPVNTLYNELVQIWRKCQDWLKVCNLKKTSYHDGSFDRNGGRSLLKNVNRLEEFSPANNLRAIKYFRALNEVIAAC